jgi:hypothetical protein
MKRRPKTSIAERFEALDRASVMEILHDMVVQLEIITHSNSFTGARQEWLEQSLERIQLVVNHWIQEVTRSPAVRSTTVCRTVAASEPKAPMSAMDAILDMLTIYHDDIDEDDLTPMQRQRIQVAVHNLIVVYNEIKMRVQ